MANGPRTALLAATILCLAGPGPAGAAPNKPIPAKFTVQPSSVAAGALTTLQFKYQANVSFTNAPVTLVVPAGWTQPVASPATANGYVSVTKGTCTGAGSMSVTGTGPWTVTLSGITCGSKKSFTLTYARTRATVGGPSSFASTVNAIALAPVVVNVTAGAASKLVVTQQPAGARGGTAFTTQPKVSITDVAGTVVASTAPVTLTLAGGTPGASFSCTTNPRSAVGGVATFAGCKVDKAGTGYTLHATSGSLTATDSDPFDVTPGPTASLAFTTQPASSMTTGTSFPTEPQVTQYDAGGNLANPSVSLLLSVEPGTPVTGDPGFVFGCPPKTGSVTTFDAPCGMNGNGQGYRLRAHNLPGTIFTTSDPFDIVAASATKVVFTQSPGSGITGGVAFPDQPVVAIQDADGHVVTSDTSTVTLSITGGTPSSGGPGTLSGCSGSNTNGVVTFSGCAIDAIGTGYQLHATAGSLTADDSDAFDVTAGPAAQLDLVLADASVSADDGSTTATATLTDAGGNGVSGATVTITSATATTGDVSDNGDGTYTATVATSLATTHTVVATSGSLTDSADLIVTAGDPTYLDLSLDPNPVAANEPTTAKVTLIDGHNNGVPGLSPLVTSDPDATLGTLSDKGDGTYEITVSSTQSGVYTIRAELDLLFESEDLTVNPAAAATLALSLVDSSIDADGGTSTATATLTDTYGNPVAVGLVAITSADTGATVGEVTNNHDGTYTATVTSHTAGTYDIYATAGPGADDTETLTVNPGAPVLLVLGLDPATVDAGEPSTATATVTDAYDNGVPGLVVSITSDEVTTVGEVTGQLDGTYTATVSSTLAVLHDVTATYGGLSDTESLEVVSGPADHLAFGTQPGTTPDFCTEDFEGSPPIPGLPPGLLCIGQALGYLPPPTFNGEDLTTQPVVVVLDEYGNLTDSTAPVTLSIYPDSGNPSGDLTCDDNQVDAVLGAATFAGCSVSYAGSGYQLLAESGSLGSALSDPFTVYQAPPSNITLVLDRTTITADGVDVATATVTLTDFNGTLVSGWFPSIYSSGFAQASTFLDNEDGTYTATIWGYVAGTETITASVSYFGPYDTEDLTLVAGPPYTVEKKGGDGQTLTVGLPATDSLCVQVRDYFDNVVVGTSVGFEWLQDLQAGATPESASVTTDEYGNACTVVTANHYAGGYLVRASAGDYYADFTLGNVPDAPVAFENVSGSPQDASVGAQYVEALGLRVVDQYGNPIEDVTVDFQVPSSGASVTLSNYAPVTDTNGNVSVTATANGIGGDVEVTASAGTATTTFYLHNST